MIIYYELVEKTAEDLKPKELENARTMNCLLCSESIFGINLPDYAICKYCYEKIKSGIYHLSDLEKRRFGIKNLLQFSQN